MYLKISPGLIVYQKKWIFPDNIFGVTVSSNMKTFPKPFYLNFKLFKTLLFCSFIIFKRAHETNIPSSYIYFMKTTNEWIVGDTI